MSNKKSALLTPPQPAAILAAQAPSGRGDKSPPAVKPASGAHGEGPLGPSIEPAVRGR